jgi:hypothetical protein
VIRAAAAALCLVAAACGDVAPGIYGDVRESETTGDLGGMELELIGKGDDARAEFVVCEGWCNTVIEAPVEFTDDGFTFHYIEHEYAPGGRSTSVRYDVDAAEIDNGLRVTVTPANNRAGAFSGDLPRIDERFGLAVAAEN